MADKTGTQNETSTRDGKIIAKGLRDGMRLFGVRIEMRAEVVTDAYPEQPVRDEESRQNVVTWVSVDCGEKEIKRCLTRIGRDLFKTFQAESVPLAIDRARKANQQLKRCKD